ncbi:MAG: DNA recombination protein RmuC [Campylobacteraceae bacterium]|nr:DNA recombination protein RmuC [Campylobacteraceae bacterium]
MLKNDFLILALVLVFSFLLICLLFKLLYDKKIQKKLFEYELNIQNLHNTYKQELNKSASLLKEKDFEIEALSSKYEEKEKYYNKIQENEQNSYAQKLLLLEESKLEIKKEFELISSKIFDENTRKSNDNLSLVLTPLKEQLAGFNQRVNAIYIEETKQRSSLLNEIKTLKDLNLKISDDAINLTKALKGENKTQGDWGEMILSKILEQTGLREGIEYSTQGSYTSNDGKRLRPDVIVHLPQNKDIVIDSKVSLLSYSKYIEHDKKEDKVFYEKELIKSISKHIKDLSSKKYEDIKAVNSLDFVLLFIPIEGAFMLATSKDSVLFQNAFEHNIMLVSPSSLYVSLRTIENIWRYEHQNENALLISKKAGQLYDKFYSFVKDMEDIGLHINRTQKSYEAATNKLSQGNGNLIKRSEEFLNMGVKPKNIISSNTLNNK